jgi:hypothetical protein
VKRRKRNREIIPAIKHQHLTIITDSTEKDKILNSQYASVFCCEGDIPEIKLANTGETFSINTTVIRKRVVKSGRNKSVVSDGFPGEIIKLGGDAMTPCLARLLEILFNIATIPTDGKIATVVPI